MLNNIYSYLLAIIVILAIIGDVSFAKTQHLNENLDLNSIQKEPVDLFQDSKLEPREHLAKLDDYLKKNPNCVQAYEIKANLYDNLKEYDNEINALTAAINLDNKNSKLYLLRAIAYLHELNENKALIDLKAILTAKNVDYLTMIEVGSRLENMDKDTLALEAINKCLELDPLQDDTYAIKAKILNKQNQNTQALYYINKAIQLNPYSTSNYKIKSFIDKALGNFDASTKDYEIYMKDNQD